MAKKLTQTEVQQRRAAAQAEFTQEDDKSAALKAQIERARKRALITDPDAVYNAADEGFEVGK